MTEPAPAAEGENAAGGSVGQVAQPETGDEAPVLLPPAVRNRVISLAADALGVIADYDVPSSLRAVRRFTPAKRARLGAAAIASALEGDAAFREQVAARVRELFGELAEAVSRTAPPPAAPVTDVAAIAYLIAAPGWQTLVAAAVHEEQAGAAQPSEELNRMREQLATAQAAGREELSRVRLELTAARTEADELRRRLRTAEAAARRAATEAESARSQAAEGVAAAREEAAVLARDSDAELRRLRLRLADAESAQATTRRAYRESRGSDTVRLRVLLDTVLAATAGLRRELDLPPVVDRPADAVVRAGGAESATGSELGDPLAAIFAARGRASADPALVDDLLAVPGVHLIVDGYNVTKTGYGELPLEAQRSRLLTGLGALAARSSGAEVTCVFDGTAAVHRPAAVPVPRGVRVLFSAVGELADEVIVRLARQEPPGRPLAVVSNDREVAEAVQAAGARAVPSTALLARLDRT